MLVQLCERRMNIFCPFSIWHCNVLIDALNGWVVVSIDKVSKYKYPYITNFGINYSIIVSIAN